MGLDGKPSQSDGKLVSSGAVARKFLQSVSGTAVRLYSALIAVQPSDDVLMAVMVVSLVAVMLLKRRQLVRATHTPPVEHH